MSRVQFAEIKPYDMPNSLDELRGPGLGGTLYLDHGIMWAPDSREVHLGSMDDVNFAYRAILNEATDVQQQELLNRDLLIAIWPRLSLPLRVMRMWAEQFPELPAKWI